MKGANTMVYGYENSAVPLEQISALYPDMQYFGLIIDEIYTVSKTNGKETDAFFNGLSYGDTIITSSLVNFSSRTEGILSTVNELIQKGVHVIAPLDDFDTEDIDNKSFNLLARVSAKAQKLQRAAQQNGIRAAQREGRYANQVTLADFPDFEIHFTDYNAGNITKKTFANRLGISVPTLSKLINSFAFHHRYEEGMNIMPFGTSTLRDMINENTAESITEACKQMINECQACHYSLNTPVVFEFYKDLFACAEFKQPPKEAEDMIKYYIGNLYAWSMDEPNNKPLQDAIKAWKESRYEDALKIQTDLFITDWEHNHDKFYAMRNLIASIESRWLILSDASKLEQLHTKAQEAYDALEFYKAYKKYRKYQ